jgi:CHAT domain-containing protein
VNLASEQGSVYDEYLEAHPDDRFAVINLGPTALTLVFLVEPVILVPAAYVRDVQVNSTMTWELIMAAAWEAVEPMSRDGVSAALAAQTLAALGGNPLRAEASPRRHVRLVLTALDGFRGKGLPRHEGRGYIELGRALVNSGWVTDAITAYERGRALLELAGDDHGLRAAHARLAAMMARLGLYEQALLHAEEGQRIGERLTVTGPDRRLAMGQTYFTDFLHHQRVRALTRIGFVDEAEAALDEWQSDSGNGRDSFDHLGALAELRLQQGRTGEGLEAYMGAIEARFTDLNIGSLPGRTFYLENSVQIFGGAIGAALQVGRLDLAVAMLAAMATSRPVHLERGSPDQPATEALWSLDADVLDLARKATGAAVARDQARLFDYNDRARILLETHDTLLYGTGESGQRDRTTIEELAVAIPRAVKPGELALCYGQSNVGTIIVFAISDGTVRQLTLGPHADEVAKLAGHAHDECVRRSGTDSLRRLGEAVLVPVADLLANASRVYVTAQGSLADFPFHAASFHGQPLVASAEVRILPSLASLRSSSAREPIRGGRSLRAVVAAVRQPRYELLPELSALRAEASAVCEAFPNTTNLYDDEVTAGVVRDALGEVDVLHLAGHAVFEPTAPYMARILLADRPLFAFEVACAARAPRLVNLSGCRAGAERRALGGEGEGLAAAFLAAGTETVIAPLWPVRDDAALAFNEALYRELVRPDFELAQATRHAQLSLMAQPQFSHPGLWGAFTVLGRL